MEERRLVRLPAVKRKVGLGKSSIYAGVKKGTFPKPVKVGPRAVAWHSNEIDEWVESRPRTLCDEA